MEKEKDDICNDQFNIWKNFYTHLTPCRKESIDRDFKVLKVPYLNADLVQYELLNNANFNTQEAQTLENMSKYYTAHKDKKIYKKTDYLCHYKEKLCICNTHADDLRKVYDGTGYSPNEKYISFITHK